jgi:hypothetical protein
METYWGGGGNLKFPRIPQHYMEVSRPEDRTRYPLRRRLRVFQSRCGCDGMNMTSLWEMSPCKLAQVDRLFRVAYYFHRQEDRLVMQAVRTYEMSVYFNDTTGAVLHLYTPLFAIDPGRSACSQSFCHMSWLGSCA